MRILLTALLLCASLAQAQQAIDPGVFLALTQAQQAQDTGDYNRAQNSLREALGKAADGSLEKTLIEQRLGYLAIARGRNAEAIDWLGKALASDLLEAKAASQDRRNLAQLLAVEGRYREAVRLLEAEQARGALNLDLKKLLVQSYNNLEQYAKAIPLAEQVVREDPRAEVAWYQLLMGMNYRLQRYERAEHWQKVLLKREPANAEYWRQLAGIQSQGGRQRAAAATLRLAYESGISLQQNDIDNLVALQVQAGAPWQAARLLEALLEQQVLPANASRRERLAILWTQARDREKATQAWARLSNSSGQPAHWMQLASLQLEAGDWQAALDSLNKANANASAAQRTQIRQWQGYARQVMEDS